MTTSHTLDFARDGVRLLRRDGTEIGAVPLDDPAFEARLSDLRATAEAETGAPIATDLRIPHTEVLFTEVAVEPADDDAARLAKVRAALDGRTPYALDELVFDFRADGPAQIAVAVVARETLHEAAAFGSRHDLHPAHFSAPPRPGAFAGGPDFGAVGRGGAPGDMAAEDTPRSDGGEAEIGDTQDGPRIVSRGPTPPQGRTPRIRAPRAAPAGTRTAPNPMGRRGIGIALAGVFALVAVWGGGTLLSGSDEASLDVVGEVETPPDTAPVEMAARGPDVSRDRLDDIAASGALSASGQETVLRAHDGMAAPGAIDLVGLDPPQPIEPISEPSGDVAQPVPPAPGVAVTAGVLAEAPPRAPRPVAASEAADAPVIAVSRSAPATVPPPRPAPPSDRAAAEPAPDRAAASLFPNSAPVRDDPPAAAAPAGEDPRSDEARAAAAAVASLANAILEQTAAEAPAPQEPPPGAIVSSPRPDSRPARVARAEDNMTPDTPTAEDAAQGATTETGLALEQMNLIGVYGSPSSRRALVRLPSGRFAKVEAGDVIAGGRVQSIEAAELSYVRDAQSYTLRLPEG